MVQTVMVMCVCNAQDIIVGWMAESALNSPQQNVQQPVGAMTDNKQPTDDAPLDFSIKRDNVTPMTSSQSAVTSLPVATAAPAPAPAVLFPHLMDPAVMSALSAAGLLLRPPTTPPCASGDVQDKVRAYVQSKIAEEQRRLIQTQRTSMSSSSSSSSPSVDSSVERTTSPVRSSPTSTTTPSVGFDAPPQRWPPTVMAPPPKTSVVAEQPLTSAAAATAAASSRKRSFICTDTPSTKDTHYWERRRKNNEAAKRSRDARRAKEEEVALKATMLEQENRQLRVELTAFRLEVARLSEMLCRQVAQRSSTPTGSAATTSQNNSPR